MDLNDKLAFCIVDDIDDVLGYYLNAIQTNNDSLHSSSKNDFNRCMKPYPRNRYNCNNIENIF